MRTSMLINLVFVSFSVQEETGLDIWGVSYVIWTDFMSIPFMIVAGIAVKIMRLTPRPLIVEDCTVEKKIASVLTSRWWVPDWGGNWQLGFESALKKPTWCTTKEWNKNTSHASMESASFLHKATCKHVPVFPDMMYLFSSYQDTEKCISSGALQTLLREETLGFEWCIFWIRKWNGIGLISRLTCSSIKLA